MAEQEKMKYQNPKLEKGLKREQQRMQVVWKDNKTDI